MRCIAEEDRDQVALTDAAGQSARDLGGGQLFAVEILHDQVVVAFGSRFDQLGASFRDVIGQSSGHSFLFAFGAHIRLLAQQIDYAFEGAFGSDRRLHRYGVDAENGAQLLDNSIGIGVLACHFVDKHDARKPGILGHLPGDFGPHLHTADRVDNDQGRISRRGRTILVAHKIQIARCVHNRQLGTLATRPG